MHVSIHKLNARFFGLPTFDAKSGGPCQNYRENKLQNTTVKHHKNQQKTPNRDEGPSHKSRKQNNNSKQQHQNNKFQCVATALYSFSN